MWNPVPQTWIKAIRSNFFATWPGLTAELVQKNLKENIETSRGHIQSNRANVRSTKLLPNQECHEIMTTEVRHHELFIKTVKLSGKIYSDQTGCFPLTSSKGNRYVIVVYDHNSKVILAEPLKSRSVEYLLAATAKMHIFLRERGVHPKIHIMDNECSSTLRSYLKNNNIELQLVPPILHRTNTAGKSIVIFKEHFISVLATVHPSFPLHLWCRLIPLAVTTLNLMRPLRINPKLSAYEILNELFYYNKTPIAPPGCKIVVHEPSKKRGKWDIHRVNGWYLGMAPDHYRCHRIYIPKTRA